MWVCALCGFACGCENVLCHLRLYLFMYFYVVTASLTRCLLLSRAHVFPETIWTVPRTFSRFLPHSSSVSPTSAPAFKIVVYLFSKAGDLWRQGINLSFICFWINGCGDGDGGGGCGGGGGSGPSSILRCFCIRVLRIYWDTVGHRQSLVLCCANYSAPRSFDERRRKREEKNRSERYSCESQ